MLVFKQGNPEYPAEKPLRARERTNHKLNKRNILSSTLQFEPGPHLWEVGGLTIAPLTSVSPRETFDLVSGITF